MKRLLMFLVVLTTILATGAVANSDVLYSTFGSGDTYDNINGYAIGSSKTQQFEQQIAASFTLTSDATLDSIRFTVKHIEGVNQLTVNLVSDSSGLPSTVIESFDFTDQLTNTPTILTANSLLHPLLTYNIQYWVVLTADDLLNSNRWWFRNSVGTYGLAFNSSESGYSWSLAYVSTPAFDINGTTTVPEPATMLLLGLGLMGLAGVKRKLYK